MRFGSVCSGIEAASVAFEPLGWSAAWLAEIEPFPSAVLAHHYPDVPNLGDMTAIPRRVLSGEIEAPDMLCGGTPCFTAGHAVLTSRGYVPIESIAVGDMVVTHQGRLRRVVRIGSKAADVGVLSGVGLGSGIACTAEHPFLSVEWLSQNTKRNGQYAKLDRVSEPAWTNAKDMPGKQWCALIGADIEAPSFPEGIDVTELLYIAGFYLGDGFIRRWTGKNKKAVIFGVNGAKVELFGRRVTQHVTILSERTGPRIQLTNTAVADWLLANFGEYSHAKTLPAWVLAHPSRSALLDGYRDTDGHTTSNGWRSISVSRSLAYGMRDLAQTLGMVASVAFTKTAATTVIEGRTVNQRDYWTVQAFDVALSRKSRIHHGMLLRTASAFKPAGSATVFNIEIEGDNSYILDGAIVHNCQAFSVAGLRESLSDERGNLTLKFVEIADAIDHVRARRGVPPTIVLWENVPGVLSTRDNAFGCFLAGLAGEDDPLEPPGGRWANAGAVYGPARAVAWRTLDAQYFGLAQRRRRVFVVASARDGFDPASVLFEWDGLRRDSAPSREAGEGVAVGAALSVALRGREGGGTAELGDDLQNCLRASSGGGDKPHVLAPIAFGGNNTAGPIDVATARNACASASGRMDFESETFLVQPVCVTGDITHTLKAEGFDASKDGTGRGQPIVSCDVAGAMSASGGTAKKHGFGWGQQDYENGYCQPTASMQVRRLTPRECERLQGFPDDWTLVPWRKKPAGECPDGPRYKALGNSWAVPCVRWIGRRIQRQIDRKAA